MTEAKSLQKNIRCATRQQQQGLGLISALFVITVLAVLSAGMASLMTSSSKIHSQQIITIRASSAATSALQIYQATIASSQQCGQAQAAYQFNTPGLYECQAQISCTNLEFNNRSHITLNVTASCGEGLDSASSQLTKRLFK